MIFRKYGFEGARTQTAFFGSLIHRTLDDLHNHLIARKAGR
jgi:DNA helicase-2/ATP-dependent DNA helicase PcrA